jgi:hypothetical protein
MRLLHDRASDRSGKGGGVTDRPIIFSAPMVRALLAGTKTQTRRLATSPLRRCEVGDRLWVRESCRAEELSRPNTHRAATRKERQHLGRTRVIECDEMDGADGVRYLADDAWLKIENSAAAGEAWSQMFHYRGRGKDRIGNPVPSIHMPRWASRLTLIVEAVRVEPLQAISEADAIREGVTLIEESMECPVEAYAALWRSLHGADSWDANPEVVAISFSVVRGNIDRSAG